ncbi:hypothetical protein AB6A40_011633 [Gnathostoma spinigerum]|uniref:Uncharacterized protein n=1 Tax=Gnathostoma spinigerum TaxID=75299 RepID=A0ABD6F246_9BILA
MPEVDTGYNMFHAIIKGTLQVDPRQLPMVNTLCGDLESLATTMSFDLNFSHNQINHTRDADGGTSNVNMPVSRHLILKQSLLHDVKNSGDRENSR